MLRIKLVRSLIGTIPHNRAVVAALGLKRIGQIVEHDDSPEIRGMIQHVKDMLVVESESGERFHDATYPPSSARPLSDKIHRRGMSHPAKTKKGRKKS